MGGALLVELLPRSGKRTVNALATIRSAPGLDDYLELLESRLEDAVSSHPGLVGTIGVETLAAGGKRLRPLLVFLATPPDLRSSERALAGGVAVELVHMATLVHDDLLDGADLRRGQPTVWAAHGERAAMATGDYLFARAFAQLAATGDPDTVSILANASLALARGEALQRRQAFRPDTSVEDYLARCALKTGKLFEAACLLGGVRRELGSFGLALGIAFQIADDILDCTGDHHSTGKAGGVDLRDGTPTLPLILAAQADREVWRALAGERVDDALERVAASGALEEARLVALEYARHARAALDGEPDRDSLEALTHAVVDRDT
jgi:geranylgeranyl pyrophosphate synthase